jgi:hypothetical protein
MLRRKISQDLSSFIDLFVGSVREARRFGIYV